MLETYGIRNRIWRKDYLISPDGPRSAEPGVAMLLWRWPLEGANKGKTANEARRNETETRHEANKGNDKQATKHDDTKQNGTRQDETKAAAPTAEPQGEGGGGEGKGNVTLGLLWAPWESG